METNIGLIFIIIGYATSSGMIFWAWHHEEDDNLISYGLLAVSVIGHFIVIPTQMTKWQSMGHMGLFLISVTLGIFISWAIPYIKEIDFKSLFRKKRKRSKQA
ncbi:MAG: hypothetical protein ACPGO5_04840 [Patescibacteria group bacterium]